MVIGSALYVWLILRLCKGIGAVTSASVFRYRRKAAVRRSTTVSLVDNSYYVRNVDELASLNDRVLVNH